MIVFFFYLNPGIQNSTVFQLIRSNRKKSVLKYKTVLIIMYIIQKKKNLNLKFYLKKINTELLTLMTICSIHL
jgi:hypothetical protein